MNFHALESALEGMVSDQVVERDFRRVRGVGFRRVIEGVQQWLALSPIKHPSSFDLTSHVRVRFDKVEALVQEIGTIVDADLPEFLRPSEEQKKYSGTLSAELGNLDAGRQWRVTVSDESQLRGAANRIVGKFVSVGLPWLSEVSHFNCAYELLSVDGKASMAVAPLAADRAKAACAMCVVLNRKHELQELIEAKREFLSSVNDPALERFSHFGRELLRRYA